MVAERDITMGEEICHSYDSGDNDDDNVGLWEQGNRKERDLNRNGSEMTKEKQKIHVVSTSLTSAQLLHTFGFVDIDEAGKRILYYFDKEQAGFENPDSISTINAAGLGNNVTPAILTKKEIRHACHEVASSSYPNELRKFMKENGLVEEGWEYWDIPLSNDSMKSDAGAESRLRDKATAVSNASRENNELNSLRWESLKYLPDEIVVSPNHLLSDELITICCLHFLPDNAISEIISYSHAPLDKKPTHNSQPNDLLLSSEALEDYFLGKIVLQAIVHAVEKKLKKYKFSPNNLQMKCEDCGQSMQRSEFLDLLGGFYRNERKSENKMSFSWGESETGDAHVLSMLISSNAMKNSGASNDLFRKFMYGMMISLEERACLLELKQAANDRLVQLDESEDDI